MTTRAHSLGAAASAAHAQALLSVPGPTRSKGKWGHGAQAQSLGRGAWFCKVSPAGPGGHSPTRRRRTCHTCSQWALPGNEQLHQAQVATGGCGMQGCPALAVAGVDVGPGLQELLHHLPEVINAALRTGRPEHQPWPAPSPTALG